MTLRPRFRLPCVLLSVVLTGALGAQDEAHEPRRIVPREWLVLDPVDGRGRRPFRPDAVLQSVLVEGRMPEAGAELEGEVDRSAWREATPDGDGRLALGRAGYAWTTVRCEEDGVYLARLERASTLLVDGVPHTGDVYGYGHRGVPVALSAGENAVLVTGTRGAFSLAFEPVEPDENGLLIGTWDLTVPDVLAGSATEVEAGVLVLNASRERRTGLVLSTGDGERFRVAECEAFTLEPLQVTHVPVPIAPVSEHAAFAEPGELELALRFLEGGEVADEATLAIPVRDPAGLQRHTYRSSVDDSVQEYVLLPPKGEKEPDAPMRLLLSLHGAGVNPWGQASSYAAQPDFWIVAPTNRRPFGFDWQDWGRRDAYDVLALALERSGVDRRRVYLGGHSMGGHGTWHLAANDPDGFAAIAPSAGWRSFDTYGGRPEGELREVWHAADAASDTEALIGNLAQVPTYILHGEADESVPVSEARAMEALLREAGAEPRAHYEEGKGHWWDAGVGPGTDCLAWPGFFELFRSTEIPAAPTEIEFTTVDPSVDSRHHWVEILRPVVYGRPSEVRARFDQGEGVVELQVRNVALLRVQPPSRDRTLVVGGEPPQVVWSASDPAGATDPLFLWASTTFLDRRQPPRVSEWKVLDHAGHESQKGPESSGPLKRGLDRRFALVIPTAGRAEENSSVLERARYDASVWVYRGNGHARLVRDVDVLNDPEAYVGRNLVLYGNADTNLAWETVFGPDLPIRIQRDAVRLGKQEWEGGGLRSPLRLPTRGCPALAGLGHGNDGHERRGDGHHARPLRFRSGLPGLRGRRWRRPDRRRRGGPGRGLVGGGLELAGPQRTSSLTTSPSITTPTQWDVYSKGSPS